MAWAPKKIFRAISSSLRGRPREVDFADLRVRVEATGLYTYPDIAAVCGEPQFAHDGFDTLLNPCVIVEVLSPSTETWDRGGKFANYQRLESL
jgi:Uma2 family endonuclease